MEIIIGNGVSLRLTLGIFFPFFHDISRDFLCKMSEVLKVYSEEKKNEN